MEIGDRIKGKISGTVYVITDKVEEGYWEAEKEE